MTRERFGSIAVIVLAAFLLLYGFALLVPIAIPVWVSALLAIAAGILLLVGK